jgi:hypothetical protein
MKIAGQVACHRAITPGTFLLASLLLLAGCSKIHQTNMSPLDTAGMHPDTIEQLHKDHVTDDEVQQLLTAGRNGLSEPGCLELVSIARSRHRSFAEGETVAGMLGAGLKESSVLTIVRLDQLAGFSGEAQAMRLAGISDDVVLNIARRRAKGETVISGSRLAGLRNVGYSNVELVAALDRGITDKQAQEAIARHTNGPRTFVHQVGRRR